MGIVNRRNAMFGWLVWNIAKGVAKRKAKAAAPAVDTKKKRPNAPLLVLGLAGAGAAAYWWFRRGGDDADSFG